MTMSYTVRGFVIIELNINQKLQVNYVELDKVGCFENIFFIKHEKRKRAEIHF